MKKFWILPVTALMISCGAATEEAPAAAPVEEVVAPVEEVAPVADSTMEEAAADSTMEEAAADSTMEEAHDGHDH
jgi:hypothetical protein